MSKKKRSTRRIWRRRIKQVRYVHPDDPAIKDECFDPIVEEDEDGKATETLSLYDQYVESDYTEYDLLKFDGEPAVITLKPLTGHQQEICFDMGNGAAQSNTIGRCAIEKIAGVPLEVPIEFEKEGSKGLVISRAWWYEHNPFPVDVVTAIAEVVFKLSMARSPLSGRSGKHPGPAQ